MFFYHWIVDYWIPDFLLTEKGPKFIGNSSQIFCTFLCVKHVMKIAHHLETSGQAERYNKTIVL